MLKKALLVSLLLFSGALSTAAPQLRIGPIEGLTETRRVLPGEIDLPVGTSVLLELAWGRNLADINTDGRVDLADYATLAVCFGNDGGLQAGACAPADYAASDLDADGDVDQDDAALFRIAHDDPRPFEVRQVTWTGAGEISRDGAASTARLGPSSRERTP
jgi:hypothetical protein